MQQPPQQKPSLIGSTLFKLEQAARSAAPGLSQQVDKLLGSVGLNSNSTAAQSGGYYQPAAAMPPYPGATQTYWPQNAPVSGYTEPQV
jgi:hypothetical protein